jgi:ABC-type antimicrobial peptide transport system permease subunit
MSIGISFFTIGYNWLKYETSYDSFHPDSKHIFEVYGVDKQTGKKTALLPMVLGEKLTQEFPEVENLAIYYIQYPNPVKWNEKDLGELDFKFVDEHFFELFPPTIIAGQTDRLLHSVEDLIITEDFARKYWASPEDAIGTKFMAGFNYNEPLTIVAVMANLPANSNFHGEGFRQDILDRKFHSLKAADKLWIMMHQKIFVLLNKQANVKAFEKKLQNYAIDNKHNENLALKIANITEVRHTLGSDISFNIDYIRTFVGAGLLLMFCALFNFLNLYINRMLRRSREIKLRKTVGASNFSIVKLFQTELYLQLLIAFIVGIILLIQVIPVFEQRFETHIAQPDIFIKYLIVSAVTFMLMFIFCLLSEIKLARFSTLTQSSGKAANYRILRKISICIQLSICVFFMMSALVFHSQVSLMNSFDWGFNSEGLIKITMNAKEQENISKDIAQLPIVKQFTNTGIFEIKKEPNFNVGNAEINGTEIGQPFISDEVGNNFINTFEIPILEGHMFTDADLVEFTYGGSQYKRADKAVVTESFRKLMNTENVIGEKILLPRPNIISRSGEYGKQEMEIIGVIKDFHITSLQNKTYPVILLQMMSKSQWKGVYNYAKVETGKEQEAIKAMKDIFAKYASAGDPEVPKIEIVNDILHDMNKSENASLQLFSVLAVLCIVIAIFGIYSISSSNMDRRKREIAIRKVNGATTGDIIRMFLFEYSRILIVANVIALPVAFYFMHQWLMQYVYKINIEPWMFILVLISTLAIVILTVLSQVIAAARRNPAEVLKSE